MIPADRRLLSSMLDGIPLVRTPFHDLGASIGMSGREVITRLGNLINEGVIRRFGARIDHQSLGYTANAMVCWIVSEDKVELIGRTIAGYPAVTHCYERGIVPGAWEYNLFCVIHGFTADEVRATVREIEQGTGISGHIILFSKKKFKHTPFTIVAGEES